MTKDIKSNNLEQSKTVSNGQPQPRKLSHKEMEHIVKLSLVRECNIYGKPYKETQKFFKDRSLSLSSTQWKNLRLELKSPKSAKNWFSKEAMYVIEEDHMLSVERIRSLEDKLLEQFDNIYTKTKKSTQDIHLLIKLVAQFQSLQETKTKMFSATPLVQEMMEVHARQQEEQQAPPIQAKIDKEKEITND